MRLLRYYITILTIVFSVTKTFSQTYNFRNYNTEHGLSQSQVLSLFQDSKGYMWLGTNTGGVSKFDGRTFTTFNTSKGLINDVVFSISESKSNELYFATAKGVSKFNGFKFENLNEKNGLNNTFVFRVLCDDDIVWAATQQGVYTIKDNKAVLFNLNEELNQSAVTRIFKDSKGNIWFGTFENGVFQYNKKQGTIKHFTIKDGLTNNSIYSFGERKNGDILIGTQYGLSSIDSNNKVHIEDEIPSNNNITITSILHDKDDVFYFGTQAEGVFRFNFTKRITEVAFNLKNGLTKNSIEALYRDRENNLWIGTDGSGAYKYYNNKFIYYTKSNGLPESYVNVSVEDVNNNLWIALRSNGLIKLNKSGMESFTFNVKNKNTIPDNNIQAILPLKEGSVLFGTQDGLCKYSNGKFSTYDIDNFRHQYIISLYQSKNGVIWIGTNNGLYTFANDKIEEVKEVNNLFKNGNLFLVFFITEDKLGTIWIGTENGVVEFKNKKAQIFNSSNGFINSVINNGITDSKGNLWFGTEEGLYFYDHQNFSKIGSEYGLSNSYINFVLQHKQKIYIGTNNGIDIINVNDHYYNKKRVRHLGKDDGLLNLESNYNSASVDSKGRLLIGTISGLEIYDPNEDMPNYKEAVLNISEIKLFYGLEDISSYCKSLDPVTLLPNNLVLPHSKNNLTFKFTGISLIAPEKVKYKFKLEGLDDEWAPEDSKNEVTYSSIPPGTYTLMVKACNNEGLWNKNASTFVFTVNPPWYNTWWFYTLSSILLISSVIAYNYIKTNKLKKDKEKLEGLVNERTRELREEKEKVEVINKEVIQQKAEIENKNIEITDSIKYAKNIQEALLPSLVATEKSFTDSFILYLPKDIVSGDFFWHSKHNDIHYIAAADCTGHGVPGAFMSIVGNNLLHEIINQRNISKPGDILLELHKGVKIALNQNNKESERRDGMDIALCAIDLKQNRIEYAGANRPLWLFRKDKGYEIEIIKPTKHPIGGLELEDKRVYENHEISYETGDTFYIFSDGFADQFGGPKGKKFMLSNMQNLIKENIDRSMKDQKANIANAFKLWKDNLEQVDDVLLIGIRL